MERGVGVVVEGVVEGMVGVVVVGGVVIGGGVVAVGVVVCVCARVCVLVVVCVWIDLRTFPGVSDQLRFEGIG